MQRNLSKGLKKKEKKNKDEKNKKPIIKKIILILLVNAEQNLLDSIKKLREMTGVGFKDCKSALDENNGDIEKSVEFLRKKE